MKRIFLLLIACAVLGALWYERSLRPVDAGSEQRTSVEVPQGFSSAAIAKLLDDNSLIRSPTAFRLYLKIHGLENRLQAGRFIVRPAQSTPDIIDALVQGSGEEISFTIPEGYTVEDIDALLQEQGLIDGGELRECSRDCDFSSFEFLPSYSGERGGRVEGYLYPETYFISVQDFVPKFFIERLLSTFRARVIDAYGAEIERSGRSLSDIMIMASLVEEETRTGEERPVVAGILWKRLDEGIGLGVDATVRYALGKRTSAITAADLENGTPYNTRKFRGLPPGPIANPGLESILAALRPEDSGYWYYLHDSQGVIHYATTNEEHNENRRQYLHN